MKMVLSPQRELKWQDLSLIKNRSKTESRKEPSESVILVALMLSVTTNTGISQKDLFSAAANNDVNARVVLVKLDIDQKFQTELSNLSGLNVIVRFKS